MADTISCPKCGSEIPLSDAVTHSLREQFTRDFAAKQRALEQTMSAKQQELESQRKSLEQAKQNLDAQIAQKLRVEKEKLAEQAKQQARESFAVEMQDLRAQLADRAKLLEEAQKN